MTPHKPYASSPVYVLLSTRASTVLALGGIFFPSMKVQNGYLN